MDAKGRLSIPRVFRNELVAGEEGPPMLVSQKDHLALYPSRTWAAEELQLLNKSSLDPDAQDLRLFYASGSVECPVDTQGRVLVPNFLRKHASLENKVIVAGVYEHIEIWNPARFAEKHANTIHGFDNILRSVDQSGEA
jgi:MraZ protein